MKTYQLSRLPLILAILGSSLALSGTAAENHTTAKKSDNPPKTAKQPDRALTLVYLTTNLPSRIPRPFFDPEIKGLGSQGAALGVDDNNTTGRFTGQSFTLKTVAVEDPATLETQFKSLLADQQSYFLMDLPTDVMLSLSKLPEEGDHSPWGQWPKTIFASAFYQGIARAHQRRKKDHCKISRNAQHSFL